MVFALVAVGVVFALAGAALADAAFAGVTRAEGVRVAVRGAMIAAEVVQRGEDVREWRRSAMSEGSERSS